MSTYSNDVLYAYAKLGLAPGASLPDIQKVFQNAKAYRFYSRRDLDNIEKLVAFFKARMRFGELDRPLSEVTDSYRHYAKKFHSDAQGKKGNEDAIRDLNNAHDLVKNMEKEAKEFFRLPEQERNQIEQAARDQRLKVERFLRDPIERGPIHPTWGRSRAQYPPYPPYPQPIRRRTSTTTALLLGLGIAVGANACAWIYGRTHFSESQSTAQPPKNSMPYVAQAAPECNLRRPYFSMPVKAPAGDYALDDAESFPTGTVLSFGAPTKYAADCNEIADIGVEFKLHGSDHLWFYIPKDSTVTAYQLPVVRKDGIDFIVTRAIVADGPLADYFQNASIIGSTIICPDGKKLDGVEFLQDRRRDMVQKFNKQSYALIGQNYSVAYPHEKIDTATNAVLVTPCTVTTKPARAPLPPRVKKPIAPTTR